MDAGSLPTHGSLDRWWEVAIGVTFLFRKTVRVGNRVMALQWVCTLMPLFIRRT